MKTINWNSLLYAVLGAVLYGVTTELLPDWKHTFTALLDAVIYIATYMLLPKTMKDWQRAVIPVVVTIILVGVVRLIFS